MNEVYVIEFVAYHHYSGTDMKNKTERSVFGVFDTGRRSICYLRRFLDEKDKYLEAGIVFYLRIQCGEPFINHLNYERI